MSRVLLPNQRFRSQPQFPFPIDYTGLGKGVQILWNPAVGSIDLVKNRVWSPNGNASISSSQRGKVFSFDGTDDYYAHTGYPEITGNVGTFFMWCPIVGSSDSFGHVVFGHSSPSVRGHQIFPGRELSHASTSSSSGTLSSWFNTTDRSLVMTCGGTAATTKAYLDGADSGVAWTSTPGAWGTGNKNFNLGRYVGGTSWDFNGTILIAGYTTAVWGEAESRAFHLNPWQLFRISNKRYIVGGSEGGGTVSYTITPSGQLTLSGSTGITKTKIFLPSGNVSFTGTSDVVKTKVINPSGNVTLSGSTDIAKGRILSPSGGLSLSGNAIPIRSKIIAPTGSITFSGTASLSGAMSYLLSPSGQVILSGTSKLIKTHIQIPTGGIVFSGSAPITSNTVLEVVSTRLPLTGVGL